MSIANTNKPRVVVVAGLTVIMGLGYWALRAPSSGAVEPAKPKAKEPAAPAGETLKALLKERLETARTLVDLTTREYKNGGAPFLKVHQARMVLHRAELEVCESDRERIAVHERMVTAAKELEKTVEELVRASESPQSDLLQAKLGRLEAQIALERARTKVATIGDEHRHSDWWCAEHGVPEEECSMCNAKVAKQCKEKGDWCEKHDRAKSQCFVCDPSLKKKFAAKYRAKYGKEPPPIEQ